MLLSFRLLAMSFLVQGLSLGHLVSLAVQDERRLLTRSLPQGHLLANALELLLQGLCRVSHRELGVFRVVVPEIVQVSVVRY